ncbi:hypothetical protein [Streptomyces sp. NPDC058665]|uniref:hypothetical protein n=1 Tax=Streptomyces sp. NPDC058665 TaxID=3346586 RepID=UPI00365B01EF
MFGPALVGKGAGLVRDGDTLTGRLTPFADGEGHLGRSVYDAASAATTVYRNGKQLAVADDVLDAVTFQLPPGRAKYRVVTTVAPGRDGSLAGEPHGQLAGGVHLGPHGRGRRTPGECGPLRAEARP